MQPTEVERNIRRNTLLRYILLVKLIADLLALEIPLPAPVPHHLGRHSRRRPPSRAALQRPRHVKHDGSIACLASTQLRPVQFNQSDCRVLVDGRAPFEPVDPVAEADQFHDARYAVEILDFGNEGRPGRRRWVHAVVVAVDISCGNLVRYASDVEHEFRDRLARRPVHPLLGPEMVGQRLHIQTTGD